MQQYDIEAITIHGKSVFSLRAAPESLLCEPEENRHIPLERNGKVKKKNYLFFVEKQTLDDVESGNY